MAAGALALAFIAGALSILSPCVLPILPIVLGAAASEHRWGPAALAAGMAVSFVLIDLFVATIGYSIGLDADLLRNVAAALMIALGAVLLVPHFQSRLALAEAPLANWSDRHFGGSAKSGLVGQVSMGLLLGAVWRPRAGASSERANFIEARPSSPPEIFERRRTQLRVAHRVLDRPVAEPILNAPRVTAGVGQGVPAGMAEHVSVHGKGEAGVLAQRFELRASQWRRSSHPTRRIAGFCTAHSPPQKGFGLGCRTITKIDVLQTPVLRGLARQDRVS